MLLLQEDENIEVDEPDIEDEDEELEAELVGEEVPVKKTEHDIRYKEEEGEEDEVRIELIRVKRRFIGGRRGGRR
jgi:hypothetical protein